MNRAELEKLGYEFEIEPTKFRVFYSDPNVRQKARAKLTEFMEQFIQSNWTLNKRGVWIDEMINGPMNESKQLIFSGGTHSYTFHRALTSKEIITRCIKAASVDYVKRRMLK